MLSGPGATAGGGGRSATPGLSEADLVAFASEILPDQPMSVNEARFGLSRVLPILTARDPEHSDVLEVGAGPCILAAYLASRGLRVTALEPLGPEFDFLADLQARVLAFCRRHEIRLDVVRKSGEQLDVAERFGVAFTINALEHMRDPLLTIDNMYRALRPGGRLLAHCPNYTVPLEPHFKILLLTRSKPLNERVYRSRIARDPSTWRELTFIRYADLRRHLRRRGLSFRFNRTVMRDAIRRLRDDPHFGRRMPLPVRAIGAILRGGGVIRAIGLLPVRLQTPMEALISKS
jgi:SAM-dependent methyltransferase